MDTTAYLTRQGWRGAGHSLQPGGRGIKKPLLVSKKPNVLGLGKKQHDSHADQWWARAFDSSLKSLAVNTDRATVGGGGALEKAQKGGGMWVGTAGLYGNFVRGEGLSGTLALEDQGKETTKAPEGELKGGKRKNQEVYGDGVLDTAELQKKRRKSRNVLEADGSMMDTGEVSDKNTDTIPASRLSKEDRRCRGRERRKGAKRGGNQFAIAAGDSPARPAGATMKQGRREKGEVAETQLHPPPGDGRAVIDARKENEDADSPMVTLPLSAFEKAEKKRRKEERRACKSSRGSSDGPNPSVLECKNKGKRKREWKDEQAMITLIGKRLSSRRSVR